MDSPGTSKKSITLPLWMIALGFLALYAGSSDVQRTWAYKILAAKLCDVAILASGVLLLAAGVACIVSSGYRRAAFIVGAISAAMFAVTLFVGVLTGVIPCSGQS
jgi:hypothetical protein